MSRPKTRSPSDRVLNCRVTAAVMDTLTDMASSTGMSKTALIERAVMMLSRSKAMKLMAEAAELLNEESE